MAEGLARDLKQHLDSVLAEVAPAVTAIHEAVGALQVSILTDDGETIDNSNRADAALMRLVDLAGTIAGIRDSQYHFLLRMREMGYLQE